MKSTSQTTEDLKHEIRRRTKGSGELWERAQHVYPSGEVSAARDFDPWPFYATHAEGPYIWDVDGNRYIDCCMCYGVLFLGHRPEVIVRAIREQTEHALHFGAPHPREVEFAEKFVATSPCSERLVLCNTGFEAIHKAVGIARAFTGRDRVAKLEGGFHGSNEYSMWSAFVSPEQLSGPADRPSLVRECGGMPRGMEETMLLLPFGDPAAFDLVRENADDLAVVMVEPVCGPYTLSPGAEFLEGLREVTRETGVLLMFDEVITKYRLALGGGQEYFGVTPDMATYGKAVGGGLPIGAIGARADVIEAVMSGREEDAIPPAGTFSGNAMTVAAATAMVDHLTEHPEIWRDLEDKGKHLRDGFNGFAASHGYPATMTGYCSMFQTHLVPPPVTKPRDCLGENRELVRDFALQLRLRNVFVPAPIHLAFFSPAHGEEDMEQILRAHKEALEVTMAMHPEAGS